MISWEVAVKAYRHYNERGQYLQADAIRKLMVQCLPPNQRQLYTYLKAHPDTTTADLGRAMGVSNTYAGMLTIRLERLCLVAHRQPKGVIKIWRVTHDLPTSNM